MIPLNRDDVNKQFKELEMQLNVIDENVKWLIKLFEKLLKKKSVN